MQTTTLQASSFDEALRMIQDIRDRAARPPRQDALKGAANLVNAVTQRSFLSSEDAEGNPWQPVKRRMPPPILIQTGLLMTSALFATMTPVITDNSMLISVPTPEYGWFHITGTSFMPARPWLGINEELVDEVADDAVDDAVRFVVTGSV